MAALPGDPLPADPAMLALTERVQALFLRNGHTLAAAETAEIFRTSLEAVRLILNGALAAGILTEDQHSTLTDMVDAAEQVPHTL